MARLVLAKTPSAWDAEGRLCVVLLEVCDGLAAAWRWRKTNRYKEARVPNSKSFPSGRTTSDCRPWGRTAVSTGTAQAQADSTFDLKDRMVHRK